MSVVGSRSRTGGPSALASLVGNVPPGGYCGGQYMVKVKTYVCPSDPSVVSSTGWSMTTNGGANGFAVGNYVVNYLVFGNPNGNSDTTCIQGFTKLPAGVPDGLSNTIFFGEIFAACGTTGSPASAYGSLWGNSSSVWPWNSVRKACGLPMPCTSQE